jgi:hypothetical protein
MGPGLCLADPREQRPSVAKSGDDVAPKAIVRFYPGADSRVCVVATLIGDVERDGAHGPDVGTQLEQRPVLLECPGQVSRLIGRSEPAPRDEIGVRRDRGRRVN